MTDIPASSQYQRMGQTRCMRAIVRFLANAGKILAGLKFPPWAARWRFANSQQVLEFIGSVVIAWLRWNAADGHGRLEEIVQLT